MKRIWALLKKIKPIMRLKATVKVRKRAILVYKSQLKSRTLQRIKKKF